MRLREKTWFIILMLIFLFPVGIYLMWKYTNWDKIAKVVVTIFVIILGVSGGTKNEMVNSLKPNIPVKKTITIGQEINNEAFSKAQEIQEQKKKEEEEKAKQELEQKEAQAKAEAQLAQENATKEKIVCWTSSGKSYHASSKCRTLSRSKIIIEGTLSECPKNDPCNICY